MARQEHVDGNNLPTARQHNAVHREPVEHTIVCPPKTDGPTTRADASWDYRRVLGEVLGAELPELKSQNNAVGEKSIENCSPEESHER